MGIVIGEKSLWGQGYGTDALNALLDFGFGELRLERIWLEVNDDNLRGKRSYEKCGFVLRGHRAARHVPRRAPSRPRADEHPARRVGGADAPAQLGVRRAPTETAARKAGTGPASAGETRAGNSSGASFVGKTTNGAFVFSRQGERPTEEARRGRRPARAVDAFGRPIWPRRWSMCASTPAPRRAW